MPITRTDPTTGETREWNGQAWVAQPSASSPDLPMIHLPPAAHGDLNGNELLKQILTMGGAAVGSLGGPAGTVIGGAAGRALGHVPEALTTAATGEPNSGSFFGDTAEGAVEGGMQEMAPAIAGPALKYGGQGLRAVGSALGGGSTWLRGFVGREIGGAPGAIAGMGAGAVLKKGGELAKAAGEALGTKTFSQHARELAGLNTPPEPMPTVVSNLELSPSAMSRNVDATNMVDSGYSHAVAGKLSDIPGAGQSRLDAVVSKPNTPNGRTQPQIVRDTLAGLADAKPTPVPVPRSPTERTYQDAVAAYYRPKAGLAPFEMTPGEGRLVPPESDLIRSVYPPEERGLAGLVRKPKPLLSPDDIRRAAADPPK